MNKPMTAAQAAVLASIDLKADTLGTWKAEGEIVSQIHGGVYALTFGLYAYIMVVFWVLFAGHAASAINVGVSTFFLLIYAAVPLVMIRIGRLQPERYSFGDFLNARLDTYTGLLSGRAAAVQVLTVPAALAAAVTGIAWAILRTM